MSLDIAGLKKGARIAFVNPDNGTEYCQEIAKKHLHLRAIYIIKEFNVYDCHTDIYVEGWDVPFNSVMFEFADYAHVKDERDDAVATLKAIYTDLAKMNLLQTVEVVDYIVAQMPYWKHQLVMRHKVIITTE